MSTSRLKLAVCILVQLVCIEKIMSQHRNMAILAKCIEKRGQSESMSYEMELKHKFFTMEDTMVRTARVELVRNLKDSLYSGIFSIEIDSLWYGYDGQRIMKASPESSILTIGDPISNPGLWVKSTWMDNFMDYGFLKKSPGPKALIQDPMNEITFSDTLIGDRPCLGILIKMPDEGEFQHPTIFMAIDTVEYFIRNRMYSVFFQENEQYTNWMYKEVRYGNNKSIEKFDGTFELTFQHINQHGADTTYQLEEKEFDFALLTGKIYNQEEVFSLKAIKARFIILDFWYTSCYPCIKSIPAINQIALNYKDKGVAVYGVNMIDDAQESKGRLDKFFRNNLMEYPSIMVDDDLDNQIPIHSYPTLLILDEDYKVIFMEDGFSEELYEKVSSVLNARL